MRRFSGVALALVTGLLFAGSFIAGKYTTVDLGPLTASLLRYLFALLVLAGLCAYHGKETLRCRRRHLPGLAALGLSGIVAYHYFFFLSLRYTEVANSAIINALSPIVTGLAAAVFIGERLAGKNYLGVVAACAGVVVLIIKGDVDNLLALRVNAGDGLMLCAVLAWVVYALLIKQLLRVYSGLTLTFYASVFGVTVLFFLAYFEGGFGRIRALSMTTWIAVGYMGIFASGVGYLLYNLSIKELGPTRTAGIVYSCVPVFVAVLAWGFFDQPVTGAMIVSGLLIVAGLRLMLHGAR